MACCSLLRLLRLRLRHAGVSTLLVLALLVSLARTCEPSCSYLGLVLFAKLLAVSSPAVLNLALGRLARALRTLLPRVSAVGNRTPSLFFPPLLFLACCRCCASAKKTDSKTRTVYSWASNGNEFLTFTACFRTMVVDQPWVQPTGISLQYGAGRY
jgi:hypothetical protein